MFINPNETPIRPFRSDYSTKTSLALCITGVLLMGLISAIYDSIYSFSFGM